jgi:hypothetical protein
MCAVSPVVHTSNISSCQKNLFNFPVAVKISIKAVINVCSHGKHYETPRISLEPSYMFWNQLIHYQVYTDLNGIDKCNSYFYI